MLTRHHGMPRVQCRVLAGLACQVLSISVFLYVKRFIRAATEAMEIVNDMLTHAFEDEDANFWG